MGQRARVKEEVGLSVWAVEIEYPYFFLLTARQQMCCLRRQGYTSDYVIVGKRMKAISRICVPHFALRTFNFTVG